MRATRRGPRDVDVLAPAGILDDVRSPLQATDGAPQPQPPRSVDDGVFGPTGW